MSQKHKNTAARLRQQLDALERKHAYQCEVFRKMLANANAETKYARLDLKHLQRRCVATVDAERLPHMSGVIQCSFAVSEDVLDRVRWDDRLPDRIARKLTEQIQAYQLSPQ